MIAKPQLFRFLLIIVCIQINVTLYAGVEKVSSQPNVSIEYAALLTDKAVTVAKEMGLTVSIAVSDADGFLIHLYSMEGSKRTTVRNAIDKSHTSALKRRKSATEKSKPAPKGVLSPDSPYAGRLVVMRGGVPISADGIVIGAIGVSGATGAEDEEIALKAIELVDRP